MAGEDPMERNQKTLRKQKKTQYLETLGENPPMAKISGILFFFWFSQKFLHFWPENQKHRENKKKQQKIFGNSWWDPPIPKTSGILFFLFLFFWFSPCFCWFVPIPRISKTVRIFVFVVLFFVFRDKIQLFYVLNAFSPVAITSSQSLPHWSSVLQHGPGALYFSSRFATKSHEETTVLACLRACVHACLLACVRACMSACLRACVPACLRSCFLAFLLSCLLSCLLACFIACLLASLLACLLAAMSTMFTISSPL